MGAVYTDQDVVVDDDLVTARTGGHCHLFARAIIDLLVERSAADGSNVATASTAGTASSRRNGRRDHDGDRRHAGSHRPGRRPANARGAVRCLQPHDRGGCGNADRRGFRLGGTRASRHVSERGPRPAAGGRHAGRGGPRRVHAARRSVTMVVHHMGLECRDLAVTEAFYVKHFGFRRARFIPLGADDAIVFLRAGRLLSRAVQGDTAQRHPGADRGRSRVPRLAAPRLQGRRRGRVRRRDGRRRADHGRADELRRVHPGLGARRGWPIPTGTSSRSARGTSTRPAPRPEGPACLSRAGCCSSAGRGCRGRTCA